MNRIGGRRVVTLWFIVPLGFAIAFLALETEFRSRGFRPSVVDTPDLWSYHRNRVGGDPKQLVLVGASRIRLGFVPEVFAAVNPGWQTTNLAIDGKHPVATLRDIAADESFRGTVLCSITSPGIASESWDEQLSYVESAHHASVVEPINAFVKATLLQQRSVVFGQQLDWKSIVTRMVKGKPVTGPPVVNLPDRSGRADYGKKLESNATGEVALESQNRPTDRQQWRSDAKAVAELAAKIIARGGHVAFVRFPESGERYRTVITSYPKAEYWDYFASIAPCPTIHFQDDPALAQFELPDDSHLNFDDAIKFTGLLIARVKLGADVGGHPGPQ